jgi:hypothetical protein
LHAKVLSQHERVWTSMKDNYRREKIITRWNCLGEFAKSLSKDVGRDPALKFIISSSEDIMKKV